MNKKLIVAETFYSLQCEGRAIGTPAVFLRLGGCNLFCNSEHWRCDTIEVWQKGRATKFEDVLSEEYIDRLRKGAHLVITGGEPLIHQEVLIDYLNWLNEEIKVFIHIEVETNGTIVPTLEMEEWVFYWNVSPKLSNSGEPYEKRVNEVAIKALSSSMIYNAFGDCEGKSIFKFVIRNEGDIQEILQDYGMLNFRDVMLMPAGGTRAELEETRMLVVQACIKLGIRYSERLHIVIWDQKTGV